MHGVFDRISDNDIAVILMEDIHQEIHVPVQDLPPGSEKQTWFHIKEQNGKYIIDSINHEKTKQMADASTNIQAKLQAKMKRSKYKK